MPSELKPLPRAELLRNKLLLRWFGVTGLKVNRAKLYLKRLPYQIMPEDFIKNYIHPVEIMVLALRDGAWLHGEDWQNYVRLAVAMRLKAKRKVIFQGVFAPWSQRVRDYQQFGGTYKERSAIRTFATAVLVAPNATLRDQATARLCLNATHENIAFSLVCAFHWIRAVVATNDPHRPFGMADFQAEMMRQKKVLSQVLRIDGELPSVYD